MSLVHAFLQQTIYLGMPDDSVRNSEAVFPLLRQTTLFFPFFSLPLVCLSGKVSSGRVWEQGADRRVQYSEQKERVRGTCKGRAKEGKGSGVEQIDNTIST